MDEQTAVIDEVGHAGQMVQAIDRPGVFHTPYKSLVRVSLTLRLLVIEHKLFAVEHRPKQVLEALPAGGFSIGGRGRAVDGRQLRVA